MTLNPSMIFPISPLKSIPTFTTKKSLMKPDTFDFKPFILAAIPTPSPSSYHSPRLLLNRKTKKKKKKKKVSLSLNKTNEISCISIGVKGLIYPTFNIFLLECQIHYNLLFPHIYLSKV